MKTLNRIAVAAAVIGLIGASIPALSFAAGTTFNTAPNDFATVRVSNYTLQPGCTTCWSQSISNVHDGDIVSVGIYYHNTGNDTALNTRVGLAAFNSAASVSFSGGVRADNAPAANGSAGAHMGVDVGTPLTVSLESVEWYPNQQTFPSALPFGQSGQEILSGGLQLGDIAPGFSAQGSVVAHFRITGTTNILPGTGTISASPNPCTVQSNLNTNTCTTTVTWNTSNVSSANVTESINGAQDFVVASGLSGSRQFQLQTGSSYVFRLKDVQGNILDQVSVSATGGGGTGSGTIFASPNPCTVQNNNNTCFVTITWNASNASFANVTESINGVQDFVVASGLSGSQQFQLQSGNTYLFRLKDGQGNILDQVTVTTSNFGSGTVPSVETDAAQSVSQFNATLTGQVNPNGTQTTYYFEYGTTPSLGSTSGFFTANFGNQFQFVSTLIGGLSQNATYFFRLTAQNQFGTVRGNILSFSTNNNNNFGNGAPSVQTGSASIFGSGVTMNGQVNANGSSAQAWFEYGTDPNFLGLSTNFTSVGSGSGFMSFSQTVSNLTSGVTYYYRAVASNNFGTTRDQVLSFTSGQFNPNPGVASPTVNTLSSTAIGSTAALMNGSANPNGGSTTAWFDYGPTASLGLRSVPQAIGSGNSFVPFSSAVSGLLPNTTYFFRASAQNQFGVNQGAILTFTTGTTFTPGPPIIIVRPPLENATSCVVLTPSLDSTSLAAGKDFSFSIGYANNCSFSITNATLKVLLPGQVDFRDSSNPSFTRDGNTFTYNLGTIARGTQAAIIIRGTVRNDVRQGDSLVFTTLLGFLDSQSKFQTVSAFLTATIGATGTASLLDTLSGLFGDWIFWILLMVVIAFVVYILTRRGKENGPDVKNIRVA